MSDAEKYEVPIAEVKQEEEHAPVKVEVVNTVATQAAPAIDGDLYCVTGGAIGSVENIAGGDPRRSYLAITSANPFRAATSKEQARNSNAALWPANSTLVIRHRAEVWIRTTVIDQVVSASVERWAD